MKRIFGFALVIILILSACSPAKPTQVESGVVKLSDMQKTVTPPTAPAESGSKDAANLNWSSDPGTPIVSASFCCGMAPEFIRENSVLDGQIWGDGRIIWAEMPDGKARRVLKGQLTTEQMRLLLEDAQGQGFFGWDELYTSPMSPTDMPTQCLTIHLQDRSRQVCEYFKGAPEAFHTLYDRIAKGAGAEGSDYVPEKGFLKAYLQESSDQTAPNTPKWDSQATSLSLEDATNGLWVEGPALETAWKLVNANPYNALVKEGDRYFYFSLLVPGISIVTPPEQ